MAERSTIELEPSSTGSALNPENCETPVYTRTPSRVNAFTSNLPYLFAGAFLGVIFVKAELLSWYRIQEMFRFQSFHMYGVIGSALVVGLISVQLIKAFKLKALNGEQIKFSPKVFHWGNVWGGIIFGLGWALVGACPGPIFAHLGAGTLAFGVVVFGALAGTWVYSALRPKLPH